MDTPPYGGGLLNEAAFYTAFPDNKQAKNPISGDHSELLSILGPSEVTAMVCSK